MLKNVQSKISAEDKEYLEEIVYVKKWTLSQTIRLLLEEAIRLHKEGKIDL